MTTTSETRASAEAITLVDAAAQLGVHYMTAYRYVRTGRMYAEKRGGKWWVTAEDLAAVIAEGTGVRRSPAGEAAPRTLLVEPFTARLIAGDTAGCWDLVSAALGAGAAPADIHTQFLQPALEQVGYRWAEGDLTVAAEHRATATAQRLLGQLGPLFRHRGRRRGTIVLGTAASDSHALPTALMADLLGDLRFDVVDLGANTPTASFVEVCTDLDDFVGIGLCSVLVDNRDVALAQAKELRKALPNAFLVLGGSAFAGVSPEDVSDIVAVLSTSVEEARQAFESAVRERTADA